MNSKKKYLELVAIVRHDIKTNFRRMLFQFASLFVVGFFFKSKCFELLFESLKILPSDINQQLYTVEMSTFQMNCSLTAM